MTRKTPIRRAIAVDDGACLVLAPPGLDPVACLRAAEKSGGIGVWPLLPGTGVDALREGLERLRSAGIARMGFHTPDRAALKLVRDAGNPAPSVLVAPAGVLAGASRLLSGLAEHVTVWAEVTCWHPDLDKLPDRVTGFVLKGHECAGLVGERTSFVLLQEFRRETDRPLIVRGGITPPTAAAAAVAGAAGVMLDDQIMLLPEAGLGDGPLRDRITRMLGNETVQVQDPGGAIYLRGFSSNAREAEQALARRMTDDPDAVLAGASDMSWAGAGLAPGGQGLVLAQGTLRRYGTLGRLVAAIRRAWRDLPAGAAERGVLSEGGALAQANGTRYPILQGPMTRVSDVSDFLVRVARGGALPFAALALLSGERTETLLAATAEQMKGKPWGVGLLGFAGSQVLEPQFDSIARHSPDFAIVAGARISQIDRLEAMGTRAFAHATAATQLRSYLDDGVTRFIVEGRECGGHIGPMSSFVLWSAVIDAIEGHEVSRKTPGKLQVVFAGGIHDDVSAAMVATLAEPLAARGVQMGVLMGTAYLFTPEIVASGAVLQDYQRVALDCGETRSLWMAPGFASRCATTPLVEEFQTRRAEMQAGGATVTEMKNALEHYTLGRLRMATKGLARGDPDGALTEIDEEQRRREGMYMIGQVASMHDRVQTIAKLHYTVANGSVRYLRRFVRSRPAARMAAPRIVRPPADVAIIGMATLLPGADTTGTFWRRILRGESAITEIPPDRWSLAGYFSDDPTERDKIYSVRGGFLPDIVFNPLDYGIPPSSIPSVDPMQLLALEVVSDAMRDAALGGDLQIDRERMSVVLGFSGGLGETGTQYAARSELARLIGDVPAEILERLPEWTEDSFAGLLPNVAAGRVANRFDLGGLNQTVDAACGSSLAALYAAVQELETGRSDAVIAGGVDTLQSPFGYLCFAKTRALSPRGVCNTFDEAADGIVISEGVAAVVLKRLADAERDGDRIYAVIKGIGASSDGRAKGLTAPLPKGQKRALARAYEQAGFLPGTVQLFEAHGTGTVAGDRAELETVSGILDGSAAPPRSVAIGSVKTLFGHTKATAGMAGLIKVALGMHHRVLPPHALVSKPNPVFRAEDTPLFLSQQPRPWIVPEGGPRRAGISAFGFGGTNFHVALEGYDDAAQPAPPADPGEDLVPFVLAADSREGLDKALGRLAHEAARAPEAALADLAAAAFAATGSHRLGFVADSRIRMDEAIAAAHAYLSAPGGDLPEGIFYSDAPTLMTGGKLAFLFSGQGAQYPDMHRQTALIAGPLLDCLCRAETIWAETPSAARLGRPLARLIYPGCAFTPEDRKAQMAALTATEVAQPALGAIALGLARTLAGLGVRPDMTAGHSYGELAALAAAGAIEFDDLIRLSEARGRAMVENADPDRPGGMIAVKADAATTADAVAGLDGVSVANLNSPSQTVIAGTVSAMNEAAEVLGAAGLSAVRVPVSQAFHSPLMAPARAQFETALAQARWRAPEVPVYANVSAEPHDIATVRDALARQLVSRVDFVTEVRNMVRDGARVFVEIGPRSILADRVPEIVGEAGIISIPLDRGRGDAHAFVAGLIQLFVAGAAVDVPMFLGRLARPAQRASSEPGPNDWLLTGGYARRSGAPRRDVSPPAVSPIAVAPPPTDYEELEFMEINPDPFLPPTPLAQGQDDMMTSYHRMMTEFLRVQESVMRAYLQSGGTVAAPGSARIATPVSTPASVSPGPAPEATPVATVAPAVVPPLVATPAPAAAPARPAAGPTVDPAPADAPSPAGMSREEALDAVVRIVADKTGYPADALDPDQALEADLGVDSIKQMEILSTMQTTLPQALAATMRAEMDAITQLPSIRQIVDYVFDHAGTGSTPASAEPGDSGPFDPAGEAETTAAAVLPRYLQVAFAEDAAHVPADLPANTLAIVTESADGFHEAMRAALAGAGIEARAVATEAATPEWFASLGLGDRTLALIHCAGRATLPDATLGDPAAWHAAHEYGTKAVFGLLQAAQPWLHDGGRFVAVTETGGLFGRDPDAPAPMPAEAGVVGLVKALSLEWPGCGLKVIDLDPAEDHTTQAGHVLHEVSMLPGRREAGYPGGRRTIFRTEAAATEPPFTPDVEIGPDWVVLASGGARGITAECLRTLAPSGCTLVLLGRSQRPEPEPEALRALDVAGLRAHFLAEARAAGGKPRPAEIERALRAHLALRDMDTNLRDLAALGARVDYRVVDVCDAGAVAALCADLLDRHGRIDLLVHGAGLIEDTSFERKTRASFDRVFDTKTDSAVALVEGVRNPHLRGICFFTSVAGRYGNPGQADYAAANEVLNFYARALRRQMPAGCRVKAINWGPWDATTTGAGMVTDSTRAQFLSRGIGMVPPVAGRAYFRREMFWSDPAEVETVAWVADGETMETRVCDLPPDPAVPPAPAGLLLLHGARRDDARALRWRFDMVSAPYTDDHRFDGHAVMPIAGMMQLFSEIPAAFGIDRPVVELRNLRMLQGLTMRGGPMETRIELDAPVGEGTAQVLPARFVSLGPRPRTLYDARLVLGDALPASDAAAAGVGDVDPWRGPDLATVCRRWLMHGPRFHTIAGIVATDASRIRARILGTDPAGFVAHGAGRSWNFDPGLIDGLLQIMWVWTRHSHDISGLPLGAASVRRYAGDPLAGPLCLEVDDIRLSDTGELTADARIFDARGRLCYALDGIRIQCTHALNRLGGGWPGGEREAPQIAQRVAE